MTGYILKEDDCCNNIDIIKDRNIYQNIETKKCYIYCSQCYDNACMVEVDISYGISKKEVV